MAGTQQVTLSVISAIAHEAAERAAITALVPHARAAPQQALVRTSSFQTEATYGLHVGDDQFIYAWYVKMRWDVIKTVRLFVNFSVNKDG
jgi:hypothetical protein